MYRRLLAYRMHDRVKVPILDYGWIFDGLAGKDTEICVQLTKAQRTAILGILEPMRWRTRWYNDDEYDQDQLSAFVADMEDRLMTPVPCVDMTDYLPYLIAILKGLSDIKSEMRAGLYDGTPGSINDTTPGATFTSDGTSQSSDEATLRGTALCLAIDRYVRNTMYTGLQLKAELSGVDITDYLIDLAIAKGPLGIVIGLVTLAAAVGYTVTQMQEALDDSDAMDDVICALYKALNGRAISQDDFVDAITDLNVSGSHQTLIKGMLTVNAGIDENWYYFLDLLGTGYTAAQAGAENTCCPQDFACEGFVDLREGLPPGVNLLAGTFVPGVGVQLTHDDGTNDVAIIEYVLSEPCTTTNYMDYRFAAYVGSMSPSAMELGCLSDQQAGICVGGITRPISGWSGALKHSPGCVGTTSTIYRLYQIATKHYDTPVGDVPVIGLWWSSDGVPEPFPFAI